MKLKRQGRRGGNCSKIAVGAATTMLEEIHLYPSQPLKRGESIVGGPFIVTSVGGRGNGADMTLPSRQPSGRTVPTGERKPTTSPSYFSVWLKESEKCPKLACFKCRCLPRVLSRPRKQSNGTAQPSVPDPRGTRQIPLHSFIRELCNLYYSAPLRNKWSFYIQENIATDRSTDSLVRSNV